MRTLIPYCAFFISCLLFGGCSTKFNIAAPYKNVTVVYGLLDLSDTAHYIRIQKAFLDQTKSSLKMAQIPDSSYFANLNVMIRVLDFTDSVETDTIHLDRVDLNLEGYPKQPGVFFTAPSYAYKFTKALDAEHIYRIVITNPVTHEVDSAETIVFDDRITDLNSINNQPYFSSYNFNATRFLDFSGTDISHAFIFSCYYMSSAAFSFQNSQNPVAISQAIIRFNWVDSDIAAHTVISRYSDFDAGYATPNITGNYAPINYQVANLRLYEGLRSAMGAAPPNTVRLLGYFDLFVWITTNDYVAYGNSILSQGVGITGMDVQPVNTNIKGQNVLGLFTSRGMQQGRLFITDVTIDSLEVNPLMAAARIVGRAN